jgi:hypothetical protein
MRERTDEFGEFINFRYVLPIGSHLLEKPVCDLIVTVRHRCTLAQHTIGLCILERPAGDMIVIVGYSSSLAQRSIGFVWLEKSASD